MSQNRGEIPKKRTAGGRQPELGLETKYTVLRIVASLYSFLGWVVIILAVIVGGICTLAAYLRTKSPMEDLPLLSPQLYAGIAIGVLFYGSVLALMLLSAGESIRLGIDIEEDIRANTRLLRRIEFLLAKDAPPEHAEMS